MRNLGMCKMKKKYLKMLGSFQVGRIAESAAA
jgi:hypothetical protein